jgi:hypothetical protein
MQSLKVMEKFDGANFHLWKFKMRMMLSKHGFWKFVNGSATIPHDEDQITDYNEKVTKAFALLCEHLMDAQLAHIQYCENVKSAWETLCGVHEAKTIRIKLFLRRRFFTIKMREREDLLTHINMVKAIADQLRSIEVKIEDEDVYMVLLMSLPHLLITWSRVWSPCPPRMLTFNSLSLDCFMRFPKEKKVKIQKMLHCLTKLIRQKKTMFLLQKTQTFCEKLFEEEK